MVLGIQDFKNPPNVDILFSNDVLRKILKMCAAKGAFIQRHGACVRYMQAVPRGPVDATPTLASNLALQADLRDMNPLVEMEPTQFVYGDKLLNMRMLCCHVEIPDSSPSISYGKGLAAFQDLHMVFMFKRCIDTDNVCWPIGTTHHLHVCKLKSLNTAKSKSPICLHPWSARWPRLTLGEDCKPTWLHLISQECHNRGRAAPGMCWSAVLRLWGSDANAILLHFFLYFFGTCLDLSWLLGQFLPTFLASSDSADLAFGKQGHGTVHGTVYGTVQAAPGATSILIQLRRQTKAKCDLVTGCRRLGKKLGYRWTHKWLGDF